MSEIDPDELAVALKVLKAAEQLIEDDPDFVALRRACGKFYKNVKKHRRLDKRAQVAAADRVSPSMPDLTAAIAS